MYTYTFNIFICLYCFVFELKESMDRKKPYGENKIKKLLISYTETFLHTY